MIRYLLSLVDPRSNGKVRSGKWPAVRKAHLKQFPTCAACGTRERLEVHHIKPFHLYPDLELVPANLLSLCESKGVNCHLMFGHCRDFRLYNPHVIEDAAKCLDMLAKAEGKR